MKIAVWETGHEIADRIALDVLRGLLQAGQNAHLVKTTTGNPEQFDCHVGYGILRGMGEIFRLAAGKPWFNIDRGYFKPGHFDGYYRISLRGTQQTFNLDRVRPGVCDIVQQEYKLRTGYTLVCPPTIHAHDFFRCAMPPIEGEILMREKNCSRSLEQDFSGCARVVTFNSSVGWKALALGIPVESNSDHSIIGAYQKLIDRPLHLDVEARKRLFAIMSGLQMTLSEIKQGKLWELMRTLL